MKKLIKAKVIGVNDAGDVVVELTKVLDLSATITCGLLRNSIGSLFADGFVTRVLIKLDTGASEWFDSRLNCSIERLIRLIHPQASS